MIDGTDRLSIDVESSDTLAVSGELDAHTAPALADALEALTDGDITLGLSELSFMDSSGLRVLISTNRRLEEAGHTLVLRQPGRSVQRLLTVSGLDGHLTVVDPT